MDPRGPGTAVCEHSPCSVVTPPPSVAAVLLQLPYGEVTDRRASAQEGDMVIKQRPANKPGAFPPPTHLLPCTAVVHDVSGGGDGPWMCVCLLCEGPPNLYKDPHLVRTNPPIRKKSHLV